MSDEQTPRTSQTFWTSLPGVLTGIAALIGAITGLIVAFDGRAGDSTTTTAAPAQSQETQTFVPTQPSPSSTTHPQSTSSTAAPVTSASRTEVDVVYLGDTFGCLVDLQLDVGDTRAFLLNSALQNAVTWQVTDVSTDAQTYLMSGTINCGTGGVCSAFGDGFVDPSSTQTYSLTWINTAVGVCDVFLSPS